jgi:UDP-glucose 4-epimerase
MRVLVTGGAGFIGSHVVDAFVAEGHDVAVVDDLSAGKRTRVNRQARFYQVDIRSRELEEVFRQERPEVVCHQAARVSVRESLEKPLLYEDVNVLGSLNLLECCWKQGTRKVVYASTGGAVYGEPQFLAVTEEHPIRPLDPYGASKHHVEHYLELYQTNHGLAGTILRCSNVYGPRQDPFGEAGVVAIFCRKMLDGGRPVINGSGEQERDYCFVADVARANVLALERGDGGVYNIGTGIGTSVNRLYRLLAELTGFQGPELHGPAKSGEVFRTYLDASRARRELGWEPAVTLEDGLARTVGHLSD